MTAKEIRSLVREKIFQGKSKQETFDELWQVGISDKKLTGIIRFIPTLETRRKYRVAQIVLLCITVIAAMLNLRQGIAGILVYNGRGIVFWVLFFVVYIALVVAVSRYKSYAYIAMAITTLLEIAWIFAASLWWHLITMALMVLLPIMIVLAGCLYFRLFPKIKM